ncbi:MAG: thiamine-phosphate kinase [Cyanobacteria bacterium RUI128]|nr:thiamine-phosphate kinase [Cyanobacteria bacterium RUI128]
MKEEEILSAIKSVIGDKYIGDDCAYLKDLGIIISQDSLIEDVHFSMKYTTPYKLGYKSAMVNISDIAASGGRGKYITVALSMPKEIKTEFIKEFYKGMKDACGDIEIVGGDITGSDKIMISVTIIGVSENRKISSRSNAKTGYVVVASGEHGSSAGGLKLLQDNKNMPENLIEAHLMPKAQTGFAEKISKNIDKDYAMMDSSDGLADALFKIAQASNKTIMVDFDKIIYSDELKKHFPKNYKELILYGGEDYEIIAAVPEEFAKEQNLPIIGQVTDNTDNTPLKILNYENKDLIITNLEKSFNHF